MKNIIEINNVTVLRDKIKVLDCINLEISEGTFSVVIGPNGAGKTTLLFLINGLLRPTIGNVRVFGEQFKGIQQLLLRKRIGYVPQHIYIDQKMPFSVIETVSIGRFAKIGLFKRISKNDKLIIRNAMELTGILDIAEKPIGHLSGGEKQKVSIARAIAQEPEIILFDEPISNLDPKSQKDIINIVEKIYKKTKCTVVFVTHILSHIPDSCNNVIMLKKGKLVKAGKPDNIINEKTLSALYDCSVRITMVNSKKHFHIEGIHEV
jgi:ABC-type cobalamin/Fe3+-siderophores transport system ATPase subunit